jgi:hypothetical protein
LKITCVGWTTTTKYNEDEDLEDEYDDDEEDNYEE